jgi:lipoprotein-releasing system permease protein
MPFELVLALRYLRPKRTFVSVITLISALGVTLGVAVLIVVIAVMTGFDREMQEKILGFNTHLKVLECEPGGMGREGLLHDWAGVAARLKQIPGVRAVAPYVLGQVMVKTQPKTGKSLFAAPWIRGMEPSFETNVSVLATSIVSGKFDVSDNGVIVGSQFAHSMDLGVGDRLSIYSPRDIERMERLRGSTNEVTILPDDYTITGIFDVGHYEYNASIIGVSLRNGQEFYGLGRSVHGLMVMIDDPFKAYSMKVRIQDSLGRDYMAVTWMEENSKLMSALSVEKRVMFIVLFSIMVVAAFGITSTLITFVVQKTREIGMLKALGATNQQVAVIFLSQSAVVGVIGVSAGYGLGMLALAYRNEFLEFLRRTLDFELFPAEIYTFNQLPALIVPGDILLICGSAFVICLLAGVVPALNAGRLQPVEALRHE